MQEESAVASVRAAALRWAARVLVAVTWLSAATFGAYILAFYAGALVDGAPERWNQKLPGLYASTTPLATLGMAVHFLGGGILLLLGPVQLIARLRDSKPAVHRWIGRLFVLAATVVAVGGLAFIVLKGTIGRGVMNVGFGLYGILMLVAAIQTVRLARAQRFEEHGAWGVRLYSLVIGSWLYRIDYGFWFILTDGAGHTDSFDGAFDWFMAFAFYLPNLLVAELFVRARKRGARTPAVEVVATLALAAATGVLVVGTYFFTRYEWGPAIVARF